MSYNQNYTTNTSLGKGGYEQNDTLGGGVNMLIICKKYPLSGLLSSEGTKDVTQGLIPAVADIKKIVWQSRVNEAKTIMSCKLFCEQKKVPTLTIYMILLLQQMARFFSRVARTYRTMAKTFAMQSRQLSMHG